MQAPELLPRPGEMCSEVARFPARAELVRAGRREYPRGRRRDPGGAEGREGAPGWSGVGVARARELRDAGLNR